eukprot:CAMPEP_0203840302 /NCGR_PEP_ID=MMETSP0359-20131031/696_1 /ASSEMBLY_ACC=CAM_ASM_000338 /TAXON_ID=268821 /ORGANISM="Scrippsiella Hangoei, Strain SHTV-5" /LENGTH=44 /DNA_ID= /DNA_START= /DNA_END= /DNA_ORIENTATION=
MANKMVQGSQAPDQQTVCNNLDIPGHGSLEPATDPGLPKATPTF